MIKYTYVMISYNVIFVFVVVVVIISTRYTDD